MTDEKMIEERAKLEAELAKGNQALAALQKQQASTIATMQRIQGAIQFIDGLTAEPKETQGPKVSKTKKQKGPKSASKRT